jgi:hypothetical protein
MFDSGTFIDSGVGNTRTTTLSQNAVRIRNIITRPLVLHGVCTAVDEKLAEALEGEVRWIATILLMFESSFRRLFLKFERFSSLRK